MCNYMQVDIFLAMRPRHWLKNLLILVAPLGAAALTLNNVGAILGAFLGFSLTASATYLVNDVADRHRDRAHPHKQHRAIAAGGLPRCFRTVGPLKMGVLLKERTQCPPHVDVSPKSSKTSCAVR